jgi:hypothetical protein
MLCVENINRNAVLNTYLEPVVQCAIHAKSKCVAVARFCVSWMDGPPPPCVDSVVVSLFLTEVTEPDCVFNFSFLFMGIFAAGQRFEMKHFWAATLHVTSAFALLHKFTYRLLVTTHAYYYDIYWTITQS